MEKDNDVHIWPLALFSALVVFALWCREGAYALLAAAAGAGLAVEPLLALRRRNSALAAELARAREQKDRAEAEAGKAGARLAHAAAELEQYAYITSHDLKEPLRVIGSFTGLLSRRYLGKLDRDADDFIRFITDAAARASDLVDALYTYYKVLGAPHELRAVQAGTVLQKAMFNLKPVIEEKKARVEAGPLPELIGDEAQLIQLFQNLLANSLKFNDSAAPEIRISASGSAGRWRLSFSDNGIGVPEDQRERIFLVFQRLHARDKYPGVGIGLALCSKIAANHGGSIRVETARGGGSDFIVELPGPAPKTGNGS